MEGVGGGLNWCFSCGSSKNLSKRAVTFNPTEMKDERKERVSLYVAKMGEGSGEQQGLGPQEHKGWAGGYCCRLGLVGKARKGPQT